MLSEFGLQHRRDCLNLISSMFNKIQPLQGCDVMLLIFRGLIPTVIQIKPILGFQ